MNTFIRDFRYAARMCVRNPAVTCVMILSLALAIGANTAIFSVVYGVLLRPLPYPKPGQIVSISEVSPKGNPMNFADPNFEDFSAMNHSMQKLAEYAAWTQSVTGGSQPTQTMITEASIGFFDIMGVSPAIGRAFDKDEQRFGGAPAALVSYSYWQQYLGSASDLSSLKLTIEKRVYSVVGVLPAGFRFPSESSIWIPRELDERYPSRTAHNWHVIGRLRDGVTMPQARVDLSGIAKQLKKQYGKDITMVDASVNSLQETMTGRVRSTLLLLLGAVGFLLLVACANVANLMLAQASARQRELTIRSALGATRSRLVRQFLSESLLLSLTGGAIGVLAAQWGTDALLTIAPSTLPRVKDVSVNFPVLLFALGVCVLVAVGLGVLTAVRATSGKTQSALSESGRSQTGSFRSHQFGRAIVAAQLAITLVLLIGAGLLTRSLLRVLSVDSGFQTERVVTVNLPLSFPDTEADKERRAQQITAILSRLKAIPGVTSVGAANELPLSEGLADGTFIVINPGEPTPKPEDFETLAHNTDRTYDAEFGVASEGYFQTLGIPLIRGRLFDDRDVLSAPEVAVISKSLATAKWPKEEPIGKTIEFGNMDGDLRLLTIVGIVGDIRNRSLEQAPTPTVYTNYRQRPRKAADLYVVLRTALAPASVIAPAREIVRDLAPDAPPNFSTLPEVFSASLDVRRFDLILIGGFAITALLLAIAGIYGVMSYTVAQRTREFGVRMALGAQPANVLGLVLRQGVITAGIGVIVGVLGALALTRTMESFLFGVTATDPVTFAGVAVLLTFIALLASYLPARRATRVDPVIALRYE
jgi:putative ABC transport system permease protein